MTYFRASAKRILYKTSANFVPNELPHVFNATQPLSDGRVYIEIPDVGMKSMMPKP